MGTEAGARTPLLPDLPITTLPAFHFAPVNLATDEGAASPASEGAQCVATDQLRESSAAQCAHDKTGRAIRTTTISPSVAASIDPVITTETPILVIAAVIALGRIPVPILVAAPFVPARECG